jgi:SAM-dependent methyltransferase
LQYGDWKSHGSAVFPKLLGCYEAELVDFLETALRAAPPLIVDVGCAEGYYATGCALRSPTSRVVAADLSPTARALCADMATRNGVQDRMQIMGLLNRDRLVSFASESAGFLICDCEGGEEALLDEEVLTKLSSWFLLVELHEYLVPGIEGRLIAMASRTHEVVVIDSIDDYRRPHKWPLACTEGLSAKIKHELYREGRPGLMRWLCASPKAVSGV